MPTPQMKARQFAGARASAQNFSSAQRRQEAASGDLGLFGQAGNAAAGRCDPLLLEYYYRDCDAHLRARFGTTVRAVVATGERADAAAPLFGLLEGDRAFTAALNGFCAGALGLAHAHELRAGLERYLGGRRPGDRAPEGL